MWPTHRHAIDGAFGDESRCEKIPRELEKGGVSPGHLPESERLATLANVDSVRMRPIGDLLATDEVLPPAEAQQSCIGQYGLEKPPIANTTKPTSRNARRDQICATSRCPPTR